MTPEQKQSVISALQEGKTLAKARELAKVTKIQFQKEIDDDPDFAEATELAAIAIRSTAPAPPPAPGPRPPILALPPPVTHVETPEDGAPKLDIAKIRPEAERLASGPMGYLLWTDRIYAIHGQPPMSMWWRGSMASFFDSGRTWWTGMVGRGGGKSTTLTRVSVVCTCFADRHVPPGQRWIWPFLSVSTNDAMRRIQEIQALLLALGLSVKIKDHHGTKSIELQDVKGNDVSFVSLAATIAGVSGPSALGGVVDEEAKLRDRQQNVNPSTEILASMAQMFRARQGIRAFRSSSAWKEAGSHYLTILEGGNDKTYIATIGEAFVELAREGLREVAALETDEAGKRAIRAYADQLQYTSPNIPTWVANPTISAIASRQEVDAVPLDPSDAGVPRWMIWLRENASVPMKIAGAAGSNNQIDGLAEANAELFTPKKTRGENTL